MPTQIRSFLPKISQQFVHNFLISRENNHTTKQGKNDDFFLKIKHLPQAPSVDMLHFNGMLHFNLLQLLSPDDNNTGTSNTN